MTPEQLRWQRIQAERKDVQAILRRDFSASRMNTTKWRKVAEALDGLGVVCRVKFVDQPEVFDLPHFWYVTGDWLDCGPLGPFTSVSVEWLEIDPAQRRHKRHHSGMVVEPTGVNHSSEIERRLRAAHVPYDVATGLFHITGHVRNAPVAEASPGAA